MNSYNNDTSDLFNPIFNDDDSSNKFQNYLMKKKLKFNHKQIKKQRSRSLPIINYSVEVMKKKSLVPPLPPINLTSLKEIDLNEILKNPQLRHDILFDPQLQFRPNLDGERGKRKKSIIDKYWLEIKKECSQFFVPVNTENGPSLIRLPLLFQTLKDILLSLLPMKNRTVIYQVFDLELIYQQLNHYNFDFIKLSKFLHLFFKNHCAPMRDELVNNMYSKFESSFSNGSLDDLIDGLKLIFQILECMKLDIANHQIRLLRPVLIETAIDFEKDYFSQLLMFNKINLDDSMSWFKQNYQSNLADSKINNEVSEDNLKVNLMLSIFNLLSCQQLNNEFPQTLTFDHTRLVLLRADIRQIIVLKLCLILYNNLVNQTGKTKMDASKIKQDILSIVTDNNGNIKWTKNINMISLQLIKYLGISPSDSQFKTLNEFSNNWLAKQIQPSSKVYQLMEDNYFNNLFKMIGKSVNEEEIGDDINDTIANRLLILINFNWNVFGDYYTQSIQSL